MKLEIFLEKINRVMPEDVKKILDSNWRGEYVLVDIRQPWEYVKGYIPGAILISLHELEYRFKELDPKKKIILYCRSGIRSVAGTVLLLRLGFDDVYSMDKGIIGWNHETLTGLPPPKPDIIKGSKGVTDILVMALFVEKGVHDFYNKAEDVLTSIELREMFRKLAKIEERHMHDIYKCYRTTIDKEETVDFETLKGQLPPELMEGGLNVNNALLERCADVTADETDVLELALLKEYIAYYFYNKLVIRMSTEKAVDVIRTLAGEEKEHINIIQEELNKRHV